MGLTSKFTDKFGECQDRCGLKPEKPEKSGKKFKKRLRRQMRDLKEYKRCFRKCEYNFCMDICKDEDEKCMTKCSKVRLSPNIRNRKIKRKKLKKSRKKNAPNISSKKKNAPKKSKKKN